MAPTLTPPQILFLPVGDLAVPDWNPRKLLFEGPLKTLMAYIQAGGKVPRLLVWKGNGQAPWAIISGQRRWEAFKRLGTTQVEVEVMDIPLDQAKVLAMGSNEGEPVFWLDWDIRAEKLYQEGNQEGRKLTQAVLAAQLGVTQAKVSYALKVAGALTPASREKIYNTVIKSGDPDRVKERPIQILATLEDPQAVEEILPRVLEEGMTMGQVQHMVSDMKKGATPEGAASPEPQRKPHPAKAPVGAGTQADATPDTASQIGTLMATHTLGKGIPGAHLVLGGLFPHVAKLFHGTKGGLMRMGVKNQIMGTILTLLIFLFVGSALLHFTGSLLKGVYRLILYSQWGVSSETRSVSDPNLGSSPHPAPPPATAPVNPANQAGIQEGSVQAPSPPVSRPPQKPLRVAASQPKVLTPHSPFPSLQPASVGSTTKTIPAWAQEVLPAAGDFAGRFYGIGYSNWDENLDFLKAQMAGNGIQAMIDQYFPDSLHQEMQSKLLMQYYSATQGPKVVKGEGDSAEVLAQGTVITQCRAGRNPRTLSTKPVALRLSFRHAEGFGNKIEKVTEVDPGQSKKQED